MTFFYVVVPELISDTAMQIIYYYLLNSCPLGRYFGVNVSESYLCGCVLGGFSFIDRVGGWHVICS